MPDLQYFVAAATLALAFGATWGWVNWFRVRAELAMSLRREGHAQAASESLQQEREAARCAQVVAEERASAASGECAEFRVAKARLESECSRLEREAATRVAEARARNEHHAEEVARLNKLHGELKKDFEALAAKTFTDNQKTFLESAKAVFEAHQTAATSAGERHHEHLQEVLAPMQEQLKRYEAGLKDYDEKRQESFTSLKTEIAGLVDGTKQVSKETSRLVHALRSSPKMRGRWGEEQLKNILELAGMSAFADFSAEESVESESGRQRPDVVLRLPGGRSLVIDAKVSLIGYLDAMETADEGEREAHLVRHKRHVRDHLDRLASKAYWAQFQASPDFVVMFIPGENFLAAAAERDPALFQDGFERGVIITTPATLMALARAISFGWRQERAAENARAVGNLGRELYERLATLGDHMVGLGGSLETAVGRYNKLVGSLEGSVLPQARKFVELQVVAQDKELPTLEPIEKDVRELRRDRDLRFQDEEELPLRLGGAAE